MLMRNPFGSDDSAKWRVIEKAIDDWPKTIRLAVLLVVLSASVGTGILGLIYWIAR